MIKRIAKIFKRDKQPPPFDIEKAIGNYLLTLPRCSSKVLVISHRYQDKRYNYELTVEAHSLATWAERHAKGAWSSIDAEQAARLALPLWLRLADLSDDAETLMPIEFFNICNKYHSTFIEMPRTQITCNDCGAVIEEVIKTETQLPKSEIFDMNKFEWHCPQGHLLYQDEVGLHADSRKFTLQNMQEAFTNEGKDIPSFLRKLAD